MVGKGRIDTVDQFADSTLSLIRQAGCHSLLLVLKVVMINY